MEVLANHMQWFLEPDVISVASSNVWDTLAVKNLMTCFTATRHQYLSILTEERHYLKWHFTPLSIIQ